MTESGHDTSCAELLDELLCDQEFLRIVELITGEVMRAWSASRAAARGQVLSAIGEPETLVCIYRAWSSARRTGQGFGLAKVIVRRRAIDLLRKDMRPGDLRAEAFELEATSAGFHDLAERNPLAQLELQEMVRMMRAAMACFAGQGRAQGRQAHLLQRYALEDATYAELSTELMCTENALRVRVFKAMRALRRHISTCHRDLEELLGRSPGLLSAYAGGASGAALARGSRSMGPLG